METLNVAQLVQDVYEGQEDALKAFAIIKEFKAKVDECVEAIQEAAEEEAAKHGKNFTHKDWKFELRSGKRTFSFKHIPAWQAKKAELKAIEEQAKSAYNSFQNNLTSVTDDGEVVPRATVSVSKDSLIVKRVA